MLQCSGVEARALHAEFVTLLGISFDMQEVLQIARVYPVYLFTITRLNCLLCGPFVGKILSFAVSFSAVPSCRAGELVWIPRRIHPGKLAEFWLREKTRLLFWKWLKYLKSRNCSPPKACAQMLPLCIKHHPQDRRQLDSVGHHQTGIAWNCNIMQYCNVSSKVNAIWCNLVQFVWALGAGSSLLPILAT